MWGGGGGVVANREPGSYIVVCFFYSKACATHFWPTKQIVCVSPLPLQSCCNSLAKIDMYVDNRGIRSSI